MKRFLPIIMLLMAAPMSARADLIHRLTTSTQLSVDGAATQASRIGSTYSVSGNNITAGTMGGLTKASGDNAATAACLLYTSPSPRDSIRSRMPSSA